MANPWLSVIIPTFNGARYLPSALESIVAQRDPGVEVIAVDDGSTDATRDILRVYSRRLRIDLVERDHGGNWASNTNLGMTRAGGRHLCWLHQDDAWCPGRLDGIRSQISRWPCAVLFLHPCWYMDANGKRIGHWHCPLPRAPRELRPNEVLERLLVQCCVATPAPVFPAAAAREVEWLDESLWYSADWDFWLKLARLGSTVYDQRPLASFRIHPASQTVARLAQWAELRRQHDVVLTRHLAYWRDSCPGREEVARVALYSAKVNLALASWLSGGPMGARRLADDFIRLGPGGWGRYLRDSRILERCLSRIQARAVGRLPARAAARDAAVLPPMRPRIVHEAIAETGA